MINNSATKSCDLNRIPTWTLKQCTDIRRSVIKHIINISVSDDFKEAILIPNLKKILLDHEVLNNVRPISNLAYISTLIGKCAVLQVTDHAVEHGLHDPHQSTFKQYHRTDKMIYCMELYTDDNQLSLVFNHTGAEAANAHMVPLVQDTL